MSFSLIKGKITKQPTSKSIKNYFGTTTNVVLLFTVLPFEAVNGSKYYSKVKVYEGDV